jgi:hypothetical protein
MGYMSKRNRRKFQLGQSSGQPMQVSTPSNSGANQHAEEYRIIRTDLIRVLIVNAIFLAAVLAVYFTNQQSNYLEQIYNKIF